MHPVNVVVTGGRSGIGKTVVDMVLDRWPDTHVAVLDIEGPDEGSSRARVLDIQVDVVVPEEVDAAFARIRELATGPVDGLVTCAGIQHRMPSLELTPERWRDVLSVHLDGTWFACRAAAEQMVEGGGAIVTFSSVAERFGFPGRLPYSVAKAGISALTRTLAVEWAREDIRVNAIAPGYVDTPMLHGKIHEDVRALAAMNRLGSPGEIASVVLFLLSHEASFITGETIFVDGGFKAKKVL